MILLFGQFVYYGIVLRLNPYGPICLIHFLHYSIVQPHTIFYKTKEYSDIPLYMGGWITS